MKKCLIVSWIFTVMLCCRVFGQTAEMDVTNGLAELATNDVVDANINFQTALTLEPTNEDANVLLAVTRLLLVPQTPAGSNFLNGLNFPASGRDIFNWTSAPPKNALGGPIFPANYNSTNIIFFFRTNVMPQIAASLTNLANLTDTNFLLSFVVTLPALDEEVTNTIDYGDVQMFRAGLNAADFLGFTLDANNASVILPQIVSFGDTNGLTIQRVLSTYPSLLTPHNTNDLIPSENALISAATFYFVASDFIRNDRSPDDTNDLITLDPNDVNEEANFRTGLSNVVASLTAPTQFDANDSDSILWLGPYFSGTNSVRKLVPQFFNNTYVDNTLPDYTFAGMLPDEPRYKTETAVRELFPSFAGIYTGDSNDGTNGVSDSSGNNTGAFAVYISTNGLSTLFGFDSALQTPFFLNFTVDARGKWQSSNSVVNAFGSVNTHGDFNGEIDFFDNGTVVESIFLFGNEQSPAGPFQNTAGLYSGKFSGTDPGQGSESGTLDGILAADGELFYIPISSGQAQVGGNGQFFSSTQIVIDSSDGTVVQGTLNPNTSAISGTFTNGPTHGTFTITRSTKVNFDVPPTITSDLPASVILPLGNTLKLTLGATGSAPLNYRWYFSSIEDPPIPGATSSSLVVSNNVLQHTGVYQIWATVNNVAGGATSQVATVTVSLETNKPTIAITSPKSGQLWSNEEFTVTGTASDKVGVTSVSYYTTWNGLLSEEASTSDNWANWTAANVVLTPGTNTITAIASNVGGITATTSVKVVYIKSDVLIIQTNGMANITPNDNGALLQDGKIYSLTATGKDGFKFVNWSGLAPSDAYVVLTNGPTLQYTMGSYGSLLVNLVDTNQPLLKITNVTSGMLLNSNTFTVMGTATGVEAVSSVNYSLNGSDFTPAAFADGVHWSSAQLSLAGGTNIFSAYATGTNGVNSATNSVRIVFVSSNLLTLQISGKGTISPNYSNAVLRVGQVYTMTATPLPGWAFSDWSGSTNGQGGLVVLTNKATVAFTMFSNLIMQATFMDTNKPLVKITNAPGLLFNNAFTVMGTVTDDVAIASVNCSLNGSSVVTTTNAIINGVSWSAPLSLAAGTNIFSIYAVATNGNVSVTNNLRIVFVSSNLLTLQVSGKGTISPNYSNAVLRVGQVYTMTATPLSGWAFTDWSGSTNGQGGLVVLTNKATVAFTMFSNLIMQATFMDTNKPLVKITNTPGLLFNNAFTVKGTVTDDVAIASVNYSLNGAGYLSAGTNAIINGVSWNVPLSLAAGTNIFSIYAVATNGNVSITNNLRIVFVSSNLLTLQISGKGTISPNYSNAVLRVGQVYTMTATGVDGFAFTNWIGGTNGQGELVVLTNKPTVAFTMFSNLIMQANFVDTNKPFLSITNAKTGMLVSNMEFTIMGRATDNVAVASVNFSLNNAPYTSAEAGGGSWSAGLEITPGTNKFSAYAVDTSGNVSATNTITLIRVPTITTFLIATNEGITEPTARIAFDETNYLVVFQGTNSAMGQFVSQAGTLVNGPLSLNPGGQDDPPSLDFDGTNYLVAWADFSGPGGPSVKGAFVSPAGEVAAPITLSVSTTVANFGTIVFGGGVYFIMWDDDSTTPDSIFGAMISPSGTVTASDFLISANGQETETGQNTAAFDGTNFLAVWYSASGNLAISGQLINPSTGPVGSPFQIYTNTASAATAVPSVVFNGTNYLVLFNIGINSANSSGYHILGRFVTPSGQVLTNQVNLTADAGPQIVGNSDFDGFNYLMTWNQGLNPFVQNTSATINARFFDPSGVPLSAEFPVFKTQGSLIPLWAPMLTPFDGTKFVLVTGLGKETSANFSFANGVIYGAFISP